MLRDNLDLRVALGPRYGRAAMSGALRVVIETGGDANREDVKKRIEEGDLSLLSDPEGDIDIDWQDLSAEFAHLFAYARYGYGQHLKPEDSYADIESLLQHFALMVEDPGVHPLGDNFKWIRDTLAAARARWALDHGRSVEPDDLAALANVKPKTIANLLAAREIATDGESRIPAAEALRHLERREGFIRSNWQYADGPPADDGAEAGTFPDQVFVPVDHDGSPFLPSIARRGRDGVPRYAIGTKEDPEYIEGYWEALYRLARMQTPRWRRPPISEGRSGWSLVSGQEGWRRFARMDLERMIKAVRDEDAGTQN